MPASELLSGLLSSLLYPAAVLLAVSFALPPAALLAGQSPAALAAVLHDPRAYAAVGRTLAAAAAAVAWAVLLGLPLGYVLSCQTDAARRAGRSALGWVQALPQPALGVGLALVLYRWGLLGAIARSKPARDFVALAAAMAAVAAPQLVAAMERAFTGAPQRLAMVARSLGAGPWEAFWFGALPPVSADLRDAVLAAWGRAAGELGVLSIVLASPASGTVAVWQAWSRGDQSGAAALALLLLAAVTAALALGRLLRRPGAAARPAGAGVRPPA